MSDTNGDESWLLRRCYLVAAPVRMTDLYSWAELLTVLATMRVGEFITVERVPDYRDRYR